MAQQPDHTGDNIQVQDDDASGREVQAAWKAGRGAMEGLEKRATAPNQAGDLLPLYRLVNDPIYQQRSAEVNVKATLAAPSTQGYPQRWVTGREIRNLRMVAKVRETFRERPAARLLCLVGASHKPWFDHWLGQLQGADIVDVAGVLK